MKRQLRDWKKIFVIHVFDKGLVSRVYLKKKKTDQMKTKKTNHFLKGRTTKLIFPSTRERIGAQVAKSRVSA